MPPDAARGGGDRNNRSKSGRGGIHTLSNLNNYYNSDRYEDEHASSSSSSGAALFQIQHISDLPNADVAQALLRRIKAEFFPIVQRRGWRVTSVTEMCCCDDGIHELGGKNNNKRRRKRKSMPNNVWGYNQTHFSQRGKCHTIHLRLRQPGPSHALLSYEDVAGTMSHELAHCHVGPHNVKFYKLMDEIQEQHATLLTTGLVKDTNGFPINSPTAYTLGTRDGTTPNKNSADARSQALQAALDRTKQPKSRPRRLGGKKLGGNALNPREAARIAAERRLADAPWCLPCEEIIELLNDDSDDEEIICEKGQGQNPAKVLDSSSSSSSSRVTRKGSTTTSASNPSRRTQARVQKVSKINGPKTDVAVVDLTEDEIESEIIYNVGTPVGQWACTVCTCINPSVVLVCNVCDTSYMTKVDKHEGQWLKREKNHSDSHQQVNDAGDWACGICTCRNSALKLSCVACGTERHSAKTSVQAALEISKADEIEHVKSKEVEQSKRDFGGFNIYGNEKRSASTMKHLT